MKYLKFIQYQGKIYQVIKTKEDKKFIFEIIECGIKNLLNSKEREYGIFTKNN